ncbi:MAG TPA: hypothetical protein VIL46_02375, partial [Gemmataceae bacterium]
MKRCSLLLLLAAGLCALSRSHGQVKSAPVPVPVSPAVGKAAPAVMPPAKDDPAAAKVASPDGKEAAAESPRLQKLRQLQFDRRPSAILKAWSEPKDRPKDKPKGPKDSGAKPKDGEKKEESELDPIDAELKLFQRNVTLGDWPAVKKYLATLPEEEAKAGYKQLLQSFQRMPGMPPGADPGMPGMPRTPIPPQLMERHVFSAGDVVGLASCAPRGIDEDVIKGLGVILGKALESGTVVEVAVERLKAEAARPEGEAVLTRRQAAKLLAAAGQAAHIGDFLPEVAEAEKARDLEALNLLAQHYVALYAREKKAALLEKSWETTQAILATPGPGGGPGSGLPGPDEDERAQKEAALVRAVELAPKLREELGKDWLAKSFTDRPQRGMDILATVGTLTAQGVQRAPRDASGRLKALQLQKTAVDALLEASPGRAAEWANTLTLLASNWLNEAECSRLFDTSTSLGPRMHRDVYGNIYFVNPGGAPGPVMGAVPQQNRPEAIPTGELLEAAPAGAWLERTDPGVRPKLEVSLAQLYLKANEEDAAFPFIEGLARSHPDKARELADEFLRVWARNHDPNAARSYTNPYMFMYGFEQRAQGIPLTRSKQERNLEELAGWVARLKKLPIPGPDEELLARAFTACHSSAEVYRLEAIEKVFGPIGSLKPGTIAGLAQTMRENLLGVWRAPAVQEEKKTNRKQKDIQAEVLRGYALAQGVLDGALEKFPDEWSLHLAKAALAHDELNYRREVAKSSEYAARRDAAMARFRKAAELYAKVAPGLPEEETSTRAYELWFYASLGACDLGQLGEEKQPDPRQPELIRAAILGLGGELAEKHMSRFANLLFTRMSAVKPAAKFRYLRGGFAVVGDHEQAREARKVFDYYKDLVTEIKLDVRVDGSDVVGHGRPFGVFVNLRHTREIERESGGFGRYLQNQNSMYYAYNYGRPTADYRDRFQEAAAKALEEHFEVLSVTFQSEKVNSRATGEYGWRYTPYAYLLLKPRGPRVDKIPPLRIDLDFLDTSGYVVLPVESPAVPIDASAERGEPRPFEKLTITQTLDERQADKGRLLLEVKATAHGLVGELDELLELNPEGFERVKVDDQGVSVAKFAEDAAGNFVVSERLWTVTFRAKEGLPELPKSFAFGTPKVEAEEVVYQRYRDADLVPAGAVADLEQRYGEVSSRRLWWVAGGGAALLALAAGALVWRIRRRPAAPPRSALPERLTPFTVAALLRRARERDGLGEAERAELER